MCALFVSSTIFVRCSGGKSKINTPVQVDSIANSSAESLFDGESFHSWEGNLDMFRIEEGVIVAGTLEREIPNNEFLCTKKKYGDFELRVKAKLIGDGENAGIQFRSERIPDHHEVIGFQCDMGSNPNEEIWGYLYDESRRKRFIAQPDQNGLVKNLKQDDWNEFIIRAEGPRIQIWLNGFQTVDYTEQDSEIASDGIICLQIHGGAPAEAFYKDIVITVLK